MPWSCQQHAQGNTTPIAISVPRTRFFMTPPTRLKPRHSNYNLSLLAVTYRARSGTRKFWRLYFKYPQHARFSRNPNRHCPLDLGPMTKPLLFILDLREARKRSMRSIVRRHATKISRPQVSVDTQNARRTIT